MKTKRLIPSKTCGSSFANRAIMISEYAGANYLAP